jgi:hypothetical protein
VYRNKCVDTNSFTGEDLCYNQSLNRDYRLAHHPSNVQTICIQSVLSSFHFKLDKRPVCWYIDTVVVDVISISLKTQRYINTTLLAVHHLTDTQFTVSVQ